MENELQPQDQASVTALEIVARMIDQLRSMTPEKSGRRNRYNAIFEKLIEIRNSYPENIPNKLEMLADAICESATGSINKMVVQINEEATA